MIRHIEKFHIEGLSDTGFKNLCQYCVKKGIIPQELLSKDDDNEFRKIAMQEIQGRLLLNTGDLLEFIDEKIPTDAYNVKRNASRDAWRFDHPSINVPDSSELITVLWEIARLYLEEGGVRKNE